MRSIPILASRIHDGRFAGAREGQQTLDGRPEAILERALVLRSKEKDPGRPSKDQKVQGANPRLPMDRPVLVSSHPG